MYKVCIADDETYVRKSIAQRIENSGIPLLILGMAENGEGALQLYEREKPDIFFVDIKMPGMGGLEFIELAKKHDKYSNTKFIIISGYDDFEFMQKAIQIGVTDYIKKPFQQEGFIRTLKQVCEKLDGEKLEQSKRKTSGRLIFWKDFYELKKNTFMSGTFILIYKKNIMEPSNIVNLESVFSSMEWKYLWFHASNDVVMLYSESRLMDICIIKDTQNRFEMLNDSLMVCSTRTDSLDSILVSMENTLNLRFYPCASKILMSGEVKKGIPNDISLLGLETALENSRRAFEREQISKYWDLIFRSKERYWEVGSIYRKILSVIANLYTKYGMELSEEVSKGFLPMALANYGSREELLEDTYLMASNFHHTLAELQDKSELIDNVIQYIRNHYQEDVTLSGIASEFFISPTYLAKKFKEKTDLPVMQYLENWRMERARELLSSSHQSVSEIAGKVGYNDANYFSRVFKKIYGTAPKEFRDRK